MISAITFDYWNTLFVGVNAGDIRRLVISDALRKMGHADISDARIEGATVQAWKEWDRVWIEEYRTFGAEEWTDLVLDHLGVSVAHSDKGALVRAMATSGIEAKPPLVEGLTDLLPRLSRRYRLGVICDTGLSPGRMLREWMEAHGILQYFSCLTFSDELGVSKPHPRAFLTTLEQLGVSPGMAAHIGDYPRTDIAGAKGVGMRAIRFAGVHDWGNGALRADAKIVSYNELEPLLEEWHGGFESGQRD